MKIAVNVLQFNIWNEILESDLGNDNLRDHIDQLFNNAEEAVKEYATKV